MIKKNQRMGCDSQRFTALENGPLILTQKNTKI